MAVVDKAGVGWLYQLDLEDGVVSELRMPHSDLRKISLWIDDTTGNILQVMATTDPTGLVDPLVYGAAYLEDRGSTASAPQRRLLVERRFGLAAPQIMRVRGRLEPAVIFRDDRERVLTRLEKHLDLCVDR